MIKIEGVSKKYKIYPSHLHRLKEWMSFGNQICHREFWALRDISVNVLKGTCMGIVGANGAGKSTLLKIITGTTNPTVGSVSIEGRIAALLELGMGFHGEFTGVQNIIMNAKLLGLSDDEINERMESIIRFAEIGDFIDQPLRTYSSGMQIRLAFAVASSVEPSVLIIDEALSVGDIYFQQKCMRRIREFRDKGTTILFVSHDPGAVKNLCDEAILLDKGQIVDKGKPDEVLDYYNSMIAKKSESGDKATFQIEKTIKGDGSGIGHRSGNFKAVISSIDMVNEKGDNQSIIISGQKIFLKIKCCVLDKIENPSFGILIKDRLGNDIFGTNTFFMGKEIGDCDFGDEIGITYGFDANLGPGEYTLTVALHTYETHLEECFDWIDKTLAIKVIASTDFKFVGVAKLMPEVEITRAKREIKNDISIYADIFSDAPDTLLMGKSYQKYLISGWYSDEYYGNEYYRWTEKNFSFVMKASSDKMAISAFCNKPDIEDNPLEFEMFANKKSIGMFKINGKELNVLEMPIPKELKGSIALFSGEIRNSWKPCDYSDSKDVREIGMCVKEIKIF